MSLPPSRALLAERLRALVENPDYPLSYAQRRLWFLEQLHPGSAAYNLPFGYRVRGRLDRAALEFSLTEVVRRHEVLRTVFRDRNGGIRQVVLPAQRVPLLEEDLTGAPNPESEAKRLAVEEAHAPFDLAQGPVLRARLLRLAPDDHLFLLSIHHIACDAWSVPIIGREISALYKAHLEGQPSPLPELPLQYADFAEWQHKRFTASEREELLGYWRERLAGIPACIDLPTDRPRPPVQSYEGTHVKFMIPAEIVTAVDEFSRRQGTTPFAVLLAAFSVLLHRYTGGSDVLIGTASANRHQAGVENLIGFFTNALVFRPDLANATSFTDLSTRVGAETRQALVHQDLPFEMLVEELQPDRNAAYSPLFQVMFFHWEGEGDEALQFPGCEITSVPGDSGSAKFDLTLSLSRKGAAMQARLEYCTALYDESTAIRMGAQYNTLLRSVMADPSRALAALSTLPEEEHLLVTQEWPASAPADTAFGIVHDLITAQGARTPEAIVLVDSGRTLTYRELEEESRVLAARLRVLGVNKGTIVGVSLDRSVNTVVAILGILKAGGAYLPLDPAFPSERLAFMLADSGASIVVSTVAMAGALAAFGVAVVCVDKPAATTPQLGSIASCGEDLAYLIYTSGSTGKPKGVKVTHRNVATFLKAMDKTFGDDPPGTWLAVTSISFDISVLELLWTVARGYRVVIRGDQPKGSKAIAISESAETDLSRTVAFSLFYFGNAPADGVGGMERYRLLFEGARFADTHNFNAVWTPERHFHVFGGLYPNPSVLSAALAVSTKRVAIRAGSVVLPLHDPLRVAEEWAVVDNLSGGRVGISFASGWQPNDFVLAPGRYQERKQHMLRSIEEVRQLWRGQRMRRPGGAGAEVEVGIYPRPVQAELPVWITSARHPETFRIAGEIGAGLLTHLIGQELKELSEKIALYRSTYQANGWPGKGHVTLMLHTFVGSELESVRSLVREPLKDYIRTSFDLMAGLGAAHKVDLKSLPEKELDALLDQAADRFFATSGLFGTPAMVADTVDRLTALGVDEIGCLIDFGVPVADALAALEHLAAARDEHLRRRRASKTSSAAVLVQDESIASQMRRCEITHFQCTPALAETLLADPQSKEALKPLRRMLVGGEALGPELATALGRAVGGSVHNMYGPTEATVWATTFQVQSGERVLIGRPLPGYTAYVVDSALRPVPIGVPGELLLGGEAIADGYHAREDLTRERFVPDPFAKIPGGRLYRTGDRVRWRATGEIEYLGRLDDQVKLRGHRIELGEIEAALTEHPGVQSAVADVRGQGDHRGIVAYFVPKQGAHLHPDILRSFLGRTLPDYMLPSIYISMSTLPHTPNGKVNRRGLPDPEQRRPNLRTEFCPPRNDLERHITAIWQEVIKIERVGANDNFFELGGNSILAVVARTKLIEQLDKDVSLVDIFRHPTVAALAAALSSRNSSGDRKANAASAGTEAGERRRAALSRVGRSQRARGIS